MKYLINYSQYIFENNNNIVIEDYAYHVTNIDYFNGGYLTPIWDSEIIEHFYGSDLESCDIDLEDYGVYDYIFFGEYPMLQFSTIEAGNDVDINRLVICAYEKLGLEHRPYDDYENRYNFPVFIENGDYFIRRDRLIPDFYFIGKEAYDFFIKNWPDKISDYSFK